MTTDNAAIRLDLTGMLSYFYSTSYYKMEKSGKFSRLSSRPRPRLYCLSSRRLETKTLVSRTTSLLLVQCMRNVHCVASWPISIIFDTLHSE